MRLNSKKERVIQRLKGKDKNNPNKLWDFIKEKYDICMEARRPHEQRWSICMAFFAGRQYSYFDTNIHSIRQITPKKGRGRIVDNQILPRVRRQIADAIKSDPQMSVVPDTNDQEDIESARAGDKVLKHWWRGAKMQKKIRLLQTWKYVTGNAFLDDRWNKKMGPTKVTNGAKLVYQGDADCQVWSPFEVAVPSLAIGETDLHSMPYIITAKWRDLDWIVNNYKDGDQVPEEELPQPMLDSSRIFGSGGGTPEEQVPGAVVMQMFRKPSTEWPKGLLLTAANTIILDKQDYPFDKFHMEQFKDIEVPGSFWGMATQELAIGLQKSWNRTVNSIDEFNRIMAKGKYLVPRGSNLDVMPDDTHGECIEYTPVYGHKPEIMASGSMPTTIREALMITKASLEDLFSQHEVTRGTNKSDIRSGDMVGMLLEQDAHASIPSHAAFEESLEAVMSRILKRIQKGYTTDRMIKVMGDEGEYEVFSFKGTDLRNNTDVRVIKESSLPDSRLAREGRILQKFQGGFYGDPADRNVRRKVQSLVKDAVVDEFYAEDRMDEANARLENKTISEQPRLRLLPNAYDNHGIHKEEHNKFRKSAKFQKLKMTNIQQYQMINQVFDEHIAIHQQALDRAMQQQMAMQAQIQGKGASNKQKGNMRAVK